MTTTAAIPTVDELVATHKEAGWDCLTDLVDQMFDDCLEPAMAIKEAASGVYTSAPCGYYYAPSLQEYAIYVPPGAPHGDMQLCKAAADSVGNTKPLPLLNDELISGVWVKVAGSTWLDSAKSTASAALKAAPNKTLQYLNFLPGKFPGGIPNSPSPIASMLTTGLMGAGLGYGAGWLGEKLMPEKWERGKLRRTLALLGGAAGMIPGAAWGGANMLADRSFNDSSLMRNAPKHPDTGRTIHASKHSYDPKQQIINDRLAYEKAGQAVSDWNKHRSDFTEANDSLPVALGKQYKVATARVAKLVASDWDSLSSEQAFLVKTGMGLLGPSRFAEERPRGPLDINIDSMGNVLWDVGAKPGTAAMTMGALHAAKQMPGGRNEPGWVTPMQMANLAVHMGAGYVSGALVGSALGMLTGMPAGPQQTLKDTGMYLGVVKSVVPRLFGQ